ncbi:MAG: hypothetical protein K2N51_07425 [Lachnospiraceae bacterium]|nr:hypothetical protein [Lachnospiraceae bacterium]
MEEKKLKEVMEKVHIKKEMEEEILKNVMNFKKENEQAGKNEGKRKMTGWQRKAAAAAIALAVVGVGGITTYAIIENPIKTRMESMVEEEKEALLKEMYKSTGEATTYSRELTENELRRQKDLTMAYNKGQFPQKIIKRVQSEEQIDKDTLCCVPATRYMYLPDRELTDEEFLQMIDYNHKADYVVRERTKKENPELEEEQQVLKKQIKAEGGISEEEAIAKAKRYLKTEYGKDSDGMEVKIYVRPSEAAAGWTGETVSDGKPIYVVSFSIQSVENYSFPINSSDGSLIE